MLRNSITLKLRALQMLQVKFPLPFNNEPEPLIRAAEKLRCSFPCSICQTSGKDSVLAFRVFFPKTCSFDACKEFLLSQCCQILDVKRTQLQISAEEECQEDKLEMLQSFVEHRCSCLHCCQNTATGTAFQPMTKLGDGVLYFPIADAAGGNTNRLFGLGRSYNWVSTDQILVGLTLVCRSYAPMQLKLNEPYLSSFAKGNFLPLSDEELQYCEAKYGIRSPLQENSFSCVLLPSLENVLLNGVCKDYPLIDFHSNLITSFHSRAGDSKEAAKKHLSQLHSSSAAVFLEGDESPEAWCVISYPDQEEQQSLSNEARLLRCLVPSSLLWSWTTVSVGKEEINPNFIDRFVQIIDDFEAAFNNLFFVTIGDVHYSMLNEEQAKGGDLPVQLLDLDAGFVTAKMLNGLAADEAAVISHNNCHDDDTTTMKKKNSVKTKCDGPVEQCGKKRLHSEAT